MSLYGDIFGQNPDTKTLMSILNLDTEEYPVGQFQDIAVLRDPGDEIKWRIILFTNNAGQECWKFDGCRDDKHDPRCLIYIVQKLKFHPNYLTSYDDIIEMEDSVTKTYMSFEFSVPKTKIELVEHIYVKSNDKRSPPDKLRDLFQKMKDKKEDPEVLKYIAWKNKTLRSVKSLLKTPKSKKPRKKNATADV